MFYKVFCLIAISSLISCGGEGGYNGIADPDAAAGIYFGTITRTGLSADSAVAVITSDDRVIVINKDTYEKFIGTRSGNSLTGSLYATTSVSSTAVITSVSDNIIGGAYTSTLGGGTFSLIGDTDLYNRGASLLTLEGVWVDQFFTGVVGESTWVIQADGSFETSTTSDCNVTGNFSVIDASKNEYGVAMTITTCSSLDGSYSGIAFVSDNSGTNNILSLSFSNGIIAGISEPIKQ